MVVRMFRIPSRKPLMSKPSGSDMSYATINRARTSRISWYAKFFATHACGPAIQTTVGERLARMTRRKGLNAHGRETIAHRRRRRQSRPCSSSCQARDRRPTSVRGDTTAAGRSRQHRGWTWVQIGGKGLALGSGKKFAELVCCEYAASATIVCSGMYLPSMTVPP